MKTETKKLTPAQIEFLANYLLIWKRSYYKVTKKKLETVDQIIDVINGGVFTFEDVFMVYIDDIFGFSGDNQIQEYFFEDNMQMFDYENYFPADKKRISDGAWIKIRTENGFEVHYAKPSSRKRRFNEEYEALTNKLIRVFKTDINDITNDSVKIETINLKGKEKKRADLKFKIDEISVRMLIQLKPYEVRINRTKSKVEYYLPYQYEIVDNIEEFSDAYVANTTGVSIKSLYTSQNKDVVFYLTSRGISRKVAEMMATLKQTYFIVNMDEAMDEFNRQWNEGIELLKTA